MERSTPKYALGIRGRLLLLLVTILVPILLVEAYIYRDRFQTRKDEELRSNLEIARAVSRTFHAFVNDVIRHELAIGISATASPPLSDGEMTRLLQETVGDNPAIYKVHCVGLDGRVLLSSDPESIGLDFSDRNYFQEIIHGREWAVSNLLPSKMHGLPIFGISRGIRNEKGDLLKIIIAGILAERLDDVLAFTRAKEGGISLIDNEGVMVYHFPYIDTRWEDREWVKTFPSLREPLGGKEITEIVSNTTYSRQSKMVAATPISSIGWVATAGTQEEDAIRPIISALIKDIIITLSITLVAFLMALIIARTIANPVMRMKNQMDSTQEFSSSGRLFVGGPVEIQDLAVSYNSMLYSREQAEEKLRRSRARMSWVLDQTGLGTWLNELPFGCLNWDDTTKNLFFIPTDEEPTIELFWDRVHPDDREPTRLAVEEAIRDHTLYAIDHRAVNPGTGEVRWVRSIGRAVYAVDGTPTHFDGINYDITERKRTEELLRKSEDNLTKAQRIARLGFWIWEIDKGIVEWSEETYRILGLGPGELEPKSCRGRAMASS